MKKYLIVAILIALFCILEGEAKKVRLSFKDDKETKNVATKTKKIPGVEIVLNDTTLVLDDKGTALIEDLSKIKFTGYEKEINSRMESFIMVNPGAFKITGFRTRVDYLDMQGRPFHSVVLEELIDVPPGESRRMDVKSWDLQHTYYYYLGNEPRKVAVPFQVEFTPLSFWIEE